MLLNATQLGTRVAALACSWLPCHDFARDIGWNKAISPSYPRLNPRGSTSTPASRRYCLTKPFWVEAIKDTPTAFGVGHNGDGVRLADLDGDGLDDYVWLAPSAAVTLFLNGGRSEDGLHWIWRPANNGKEVASGAGASREQIILADMDGDGKDDFCIVDAKTGGLTLYINPGAKPNGWGWGLKGSVATGIGSLGKNVRLAHID
ncbi:MAG: hypothetical protein L6R42_009359, partial [Xanthoria sp. 1 TBL-2021]